VRRQLHNVLIADVGIREDNLGHFVFADQLAELRLRNDRDAVGVQLARQRGRITAIVDMRNLRRGEGDDVEIGVVAEVDVEVVKIPPAGARDEHAFRGHKSLLALVENPERAAANRRRRSSPACARRSAPETNGKLREAARGCQDLKPYISMF